MSNRTTPDDMAETATTQSNSAGLYAAMKGMSQRRVNMLDAMAWRPLELAPTDRSAMALREQERVLSRQSPRRVPETAHTELTPTITVI